MTNMAPTWLKKILLDNSTDKFYIEYGGYLSNHIAHGCIALYMLGASEARILKFAEDYCKELEPKENHCHADNKDFQSIKEYRGKHVGFYAILNHFDNLLGTKYSTIEDFVESEIPQLLPGMLGAALHGIIQIGYGLRASSDRTVLEGLAYLHHSYEPPIDKHGKSENTLVTNLNLFGQGTAEILTILDELRKRYGTQFSFIDAEVGGSEEFRLTGDRFTVAEKVVYKYFSKDLFQWVDSIKLPEFFDANNYSKSDIEKLGNWLVKIALIVYVPF